MRRLWTDTNLEGIEALAELAPDHGGPHVEHVIVNLVDSLLMRQLVIGRVPDVQAQVCPTVALLVTLMPRLFDGQQVHLNEPVRVYPYIASTLVSVR
jgi:hypothetical protein